MPQRRTCLMATRSCSKIDNQTPPTVCEVCIELTGSSQQYTHHSSLLAHFRKVHPTAKKPFHGFIVPQKHICPYCNRTLNNSRYAITHIVRSHPGKKVELILLKLD